MAFEVGPASAIDPAAFDLTIDDEDLSLFFRDSVNNLSAIDQDFVAITDTIGGEVVAGQDAFVEAQTLLDNAGNDITDMGGSELVDGVTEASQAIDEGGNRLNEAFNAIPDDAWTDPATAVFVPPDLNPPPGGDQLI